MVKSKLPSFTSKCFSQIRNVGVKPAGFCLWWACLWSEEDPLKDIGVTGGSFKCICYFDTWIKKDFHINLLIQLLRYGVNIVIM